MTQETITRLLRRTLAAYPQHAARLSTAQIRDMQDVWQEMLSDLPDELLVAAVRSHLERSQWLPSIAEIRQAAVSLMRQASPAEQSAIDAWGDVKHAIARIGSYNVPSFDNPITARVVRRMGWREICLSEDPEGVIRAQFERYYNGEMERAERIAAQSPAVTAFVASMEADRFTPLPAPRDSGQVIANVAARLTAPESDMATTSEAMEY